MTIDRQVTWETGADLQMKFVSPSYGSMLEPYINSLGVNGIDSVVPVGKLNGEILNDPVTIYFTDSQRYSQSPFLQSDSFKSGSFKSLNSDFKANALVGDNVLSNELLHVGDTINLGITLLHYNGTTFIQSEVTQPMTVVGSFDHIPGGISGNNIFVDYQFIQNLFNTTPQTEAMAYNNIQDINVISNQLNIDLTTELLNKYYPADMLLIDTSTNAETVQSDILAKMGSLSSQVFDSYTYSGKLADARDLTSSGFGIAGLLTSMFFISLLSATIGTFIFISLIVKSRSKEFAILRAVGATERQIYKIALSEVISVLIFALIAGTILGLGLAYMFNGFFEFMSIFSGSLTYNLPRLLIFPWDTIFISMVITAIIIIIATILPTRQVANQEIIEETRQI